MAFPFLFMTGHKLVRFSATNASGCGASSRTAGCCSPTTATTTSTGCTPRSFEEEMKATFPATGALPKIPQAHPLYRSFFTFDDGPPTTSHELNGWGDDIVHDYLRGVEHARPARRALQQQGLRLRVGLRLAQQAIPARGQHEVRASTSSSMR